jgi:FixJ family two-component response regulator
MTRDLLPVSCPSLTPTVFVVDDDAAVLRSLERLLRSAGLNVATFSSACEFLERHDPDSPGCLLLDVAMPGMNGLELQRVLIAGGQELPIIFLTGHGDISMRAEAINNGAVDFLSKPANDVDLINAIGAAIEKDRLRRHPRGEDR